MKIIIDESHRFYHRSRPYWPAYSEDGEKYCLVNHDFVMGKRRFEKMDALGNIPVPPAPKKVSFWERVFRYEGVY